MAASRVAPDHYRMAVYTYGTRVENVGPTGVSPLSSDMTQVENTSGPANLMTFPCQGYDNDQNTSFDTMLTRRSPIIATGGAGTTGSNRQKVLFLVTDRVSDSYKPKTCTKPTTVGMFDTMNALFLKVIRTSEARVHTIAYGGADVAIRNYGTSRTRNSNDIIDLAAKKICCNRTLGVR